MIKSVTKEDYMVYGNRGCPKFNMGSNGQTFIYFLELLYFLIPSVFIFCMQMWQRCVIPILDTQPILMTMRCHSYTWHSAPFLWQWCVILILDTQPHSYDNEVSFLYLSLSPVLIIHLHAKFNVRILTSEYMSIGSYIPFYSCRNH
jgi:hypothetical protein